MNSSDWQNLCTECHLGQFIQALPVRGGASDRSWHLQTAGGAFFVKTALSRYYPLLEAEGAGLEAIALTHTIKCPKVITLYHGTKWAGLVLEWLTLAHNESPTDKHYQALAEGLANLHQQKSKSFGWTAHNYLELSPQPNARLTEWAGFFRSQRLLPQVKMARDRGLSRNTLAQIDQLMAHLDPIFERDAPSPSLIHGNFWHDNIAFLPHCIPVLFKPACYYGDPLVDIARASLSGHLPESFYHHYWRHAKHHDHEALRLGCYQLYFLLHQFNHLGSEYVPEINHLAQKLLSEIVHG